MDRPPIPTASAARPFPGAGAPGTRADLKGEEQQLPRPLKAGQLAWQSTQAMAQRARRNEESGEIQVSLQQLSFGAPSLRIEDNAGRAVGQAFNGAILTVHWAWQDPQTGRLTTTFADTPQTPFTEFTISMTAGPRAVFATPLACG